VRPRLIFGDFHLAAIELNLYASFRFGNAALQTLVPLYFVSTKLPAWASAALTKQVSLRHQIRRPHSLDENMSAPRCLRVAIEACRPQKV
jgi:hypothetical protein